MPTRTPAPIAPAAAEKPTPGPWAVCIYSNLRLQVTDAQGIFAADKASPFHNTPIVEQVYGTTIAQSDANAALLAAAPELRDALAALVDSGYPDRTAIAAARALLARLGV